MFSRHEYFFVNICRKVDCMATFKPFKALRPTPQRAAKVAALPYDVMSAEEARVMAAGNPNSFLRVDKAEIDLSPSIDPYSDAVYLKARENLERLVLDKILTQDEEPRFYIYSLTMDGRTQSGVVGCAAVADYESGVIKKHELTRTDKENDRVRHVDTLDANTGPIFLTCRADAELGDFIRRCCESIEPEYDFVSEDNIRHTARLVPQSENTRLAALFDRIPCLYIADGHHRCASACRVGQMRRAAAGTATGDEEFNFFLSVVFPADELRIMDYNRAVADLNGLTPESFLQKLGEDFAIEKSATAVRPDQKHVFGLYMAGGWRRLTAKSGGEDVISDLDVSILQNRVLDRLLGIMDPRSDKRVDFIGGIRGLTELEALVDSGRAAAAFSMYPTSLTELMDIADANLLMPPKSTWFEPKLRSGLFIHLLV